MSKLLYFFSALSQYIVNEEENLEDDVDLKPGYYRIVETVDRGFWYEDHNKGLAEYIDKDLSKYVTYIHYYCEPQTNYVRFDTMLTEDETFRITYRGVEMSLKSAVAKYIMGQISDGWGENGIYIVNGSWMGDPVIICNMSWELYEYDYDRFLNEHNGLALLSDCTYFKEYKPEDER